MPHSQRVTTMLDDLDLLTQIMVVVCVASFVGLCLLVMELDDGGE